MFYIEILRQMKRLWDVVITKLRNESLHGHVLDELRRIKKLISYNIHTHEMKSLYHNKWFLRIINTLHQYKKKMKTPVPISLIRFLVGTSKLLENEITLHEEIFYFLLDKLLAPEDQKDVIVHR